MTITEQAPPFAGEALLTPEAIQIGPDNPVFLHPGALNEVAQVRQSYDPEGIQELARSMVKGEMPEGFDRALLTDKELSSNLVLLHPLSVARFSSREKAQAYLDDHAAHYELDTPHADESLERSEDGFYYLLIAGHRRKRAIQYLQDEFGITDDRLQIATHVFDDIEFDEALGLQLRENVHERPPIDEEARSIERYYQHLQNKQARPVSIRQLANKLGMGETKISNALAFAGLPGSVQSLTQGLLSYTIVTRLRPLYDGYLAQYDKLVAAGRTFKDDRETYATELVQIVANKIVENRLDGGDTKSLAIIDGHLSQLRGGTRYTVDSLFDLGEEESPVARRKRQDARIGEKVLRVLEYYASYGRLTRAQQGRLVTLLSSLTIDEIGAEGFPSDLFSETIG